MADQQQFFLKWNDFQSNMVSSFRHLRDEKSFTDVTLACEGQTCKAHKMVLSACSPYFKSLLEVRMLDLLCCDVFPHLSGCFCGFMFLEILKKREPNILLYDYMFL